MKRKQGFTIIEVVLVLAIAGLIFAMVFVVLPSLQASQRDTQRKEDLQRVVSAIVRYQGNNKGRTPWSNLALAEAHSGTYSLLKEASDNFVMRYIDTEATDYQGRESDRVAEPVPGAGCTDAFRSPSGNCYGFVAEVPFTYSYYQDNRNLESVSLGDGEVVPESLSDIFTVMTAAKCGDMEGVIVNTKTPNSVAVFIGTERSGAILCADNS